MAGSNIIRPAEVRYAPTGMRVMMVHVITLFPRVEIVAVMLLNVDIVERQSLLTINVNFFMARVAIGFVQRIMVILIVKICR